MDVSRRRDVLARNQCNFGFLSLALLTTLLSQLLLLHLLVAQSRQGAGNLFDLIARKILGKLLRKFLQENCVLSLLGVVGDERNEGITKFLELQLCLRVEDRKCSQVNGSCRVLGIDLNGICCGSSFARVADADVAKQVLSVLQVRILLGLTETFSALGFGFFLTALIGVLGKSTCMLCLLLCDTLCLALLICCGFGIGFGFALSFDLGLLSFNLRVFCRIPTL